MSSTVAVKPARGVRGIGLVSIIAGIIFILAGAATWTLVASELSDEHITVSDDASFFAGRAVNGPLTAYAQAEVISKHALEASGGKTYAQLEQNDPVRDTVMDASFLRASLYTSVVAFGLSAFVVGMGVMLLLIGMALRRLGTRAAQAGGPADLPDAARHRAPAHVAPAESEPTATPAGAAAPGAGGAATVAGTTGRPEPLSTPGLPPEEADTARFAEPVSTPGRPPEEAGAAHLRSSDERSTSSEPSAGAAGAARAVGAAGAAHAAEGRSDRAAGGRTDRAAEVGATRAAATEGGAAGTHEGSAHRAESAAAGHRSPGETPGPGGQPPVPHEPVSTPGVPPEQVEPDPDYVPGETPGPGGTPPGQPQPRETPGVPSESNPDTPARIPVFASPEEQSRAGGTPSGPPTTTPGQAARGATPATLRGKSPASGAAGDESGTGEAEPTTERLPKQPPPARQPPAE